MVITESGKKERLGVEGVARRLNALCYRQGTGSLTIPGQPTQRIIERRRRAEFITPIPKPKERKGSPKQGEIVSKEFFVGPADSN